MDIGFAQNYMNLYEIQGDGSWLRVAAGINSVEWEGNEEVSQDPYYDGEGMAASDVTGGQLVGTFSGHRKYGDPAQDFIAAKLLEYGEGRKARFRWTQPNGDKLEGEVTVANISPQGGDPNAKLDFSFEIHYNGAPTFIEGNSDEFPDSITAEAVTVAVGATASIGAQVSPEGASPALAYSVEDDAIAEVDSDGTVRGIAEGETQISIKSMVRPSVSTIIKVTVNPT